jgi:hypothetical protein
MSLSCLLYTKKWTAQYKACLAALENLIERGDPHTSVPNINRLKEQVTRLALRGERLAEPDTTAMVKVALTIAWDRV